MPRNGHLTPERGHCAVPLARQRISVRPPREVGAAAVYCYVASSLEVHSDVVVIKNPLRRLAIPLGHVTAASEGSNLRIETAYMHAYAWGVESGNLDVGTGRLGKQVSLAHIVLARATERRALDATAPAARYRWVLPPLLVLALLPLNLLTTLAVLNDWHPLNW